MMYPNKPVVSPLAPKTDWKGKWIWTEPAESARNVYAGFRKTFETQSGGTLHLEITADTVYELCLDGERLAHGPSRSHLDAYSFDVLDVPVAAGGHVLAVWVHHIGVVNATVMTGRPGLLAEVHWRSENGESLDLSTDDTWRARLLTAWRSDLPCLMSHFGFWEDCDLGKVPPDWKEVSFPEQGWRSATPLAGPFPWCTLIPRDIPLPALYRLTPTALVASGGFSPGEVTEDTEAKRASVCGGWLDGASTGDIPSKNVAARIRTRVENPGNAEISIPEGEGRWWLYDFGETVSGYPELLLDCREGELRVELSYDDHLTPDGFLNPERSYARMSDRYTLRPGLNTVRPVCPRGFRYLMLDLTGPGRVEILRVGAENERYPFPAEAEFTCSDEALNRLVAPSARTLRICCTDAFTDCATRERVQWMQDGYVQAKTAAYAFGDTLLLRRLLFQGAQNILPDGRINGFVPSERTGCAFASSSLVWMHLLVDYLLFSGDEAGTRLLLPTLERVLAFVESRTDDQGLVIHWPAGQFWDWAPIEDEGCLLLTNAFYLWALARLAEQNVFASVLPEDLSVRIARRREAAHVRFWRAERGLYRDKAEEGVRPEDLLYSQHANALAVLSGICPSDASAALMRRVIDPAELGRVPAGEHAQWAKGRPAPGPIVPVGTLWFATFLCEALFVCRLAEEALAQLKFHWGPFAEGPTFPETRISEGNTTQCHGWATGPSYLLPAYVLGIRPLAPGWSAFTRDPQPGGLSRIGGWVPTPGGRLAHAWSLASGAAES